MQPFKFEYYLAKYGFDFESGWDNQNRKSYLIRYDDPVTPIDGAAIVFTFKDEPGPDMIGCSFYFNNSSAIKRRLVEIANSDSSITNKQDFMFFMTDTRHTCDDIGVVYGSRSDAIFLFEGETMYDHYCKKIYDMVGVIANFVNLARKMYP